MPYTTEINNRNLICILFLLDQFRPMETHWKDNKTKAVALSDIINKCLENLVFINTNGENVLDSFYTGVLEELLEKEA